MVVCYVCKGRKSLNNDIGSEERWVRESKRSNARIRIELVILGYYMNWSI